MFDSSINNVSGLSSQDFPLSIPTQSNNNYGLSSIHSTNSQSIAIPNELSGIVTDYSLQEKIISADYLVREKVNSFINNPNVDALTGIAFGENYQISLATSLLQTLA